MRVISGSLKGKSIDYIKDSTTRPLKDSVKENIFNVLTHSNLIKIKLEKSNVLDLYSGIGSFGIECISRGAKKVTFVEKEKKAAIILNRNLLSLSLEKNTFVHNRKIEIFLEKNNEKFCIFFLDPPFKDNKFLVNLKSIQKSQIFKDNHIVIIHRERKSNDNLEKYINVLITKYYGRSKIIFGTFN